MKLTTIIDRIILNEYHYSQPIEYDKKLGLINCYDNISQNYTTFNNN